MKAKVSKVIHAIFPDPELDREEPDQEVNWSECLCNGHSGFDSSEQRRVRIYSSGQIMLPDSPSTQKRSICVHSPHPSTGISPVMLRSLGKRFDRRFGWQRANFLAIDNPSPLKSSTRCRVARYCSRECQNADWSSHRTMCKTLSLDKAGCHLRVLITRKAGGQTANTDASIANSSSSTGLLKLSTSALSTMENGGILLA